MSEFRNGSISAATENTLAYPEKPIQRTIMPEQMSAIRIIQPANGNPGPLGLFAFAVTTIISNLYAIGAGVPPGDGGQVLMGFALWYGGIVQILAGMWSMKVGNTFEATAFSSFGAYWAAYGYMFFPLSGMKAAYDGLNPEVYQNAVGIFTFVWALMAIILTVGTTKSTVSTILMFVFLDVHLLFVAGNYFGHHGPGDYPMRIGSAFGILSALMAFYNGAAALWLPSNSHILLPVGPVTRRKDNQEYNV
ncbi:hypothetical protein BGZ93_002528 [Podila epicladia]|nr:hypothetical protein BGZ93_002528 [Podila epicladia]KAG0087786.1 hypothetical protein BGZ92_006981 [Podila epicladia]